MFCVVSFLLEVPIGMIGDTLGNQWTFRALGLGLLVSTLAGGALYRLIFRKHKPET